MAYEYKVTKTYNYKGAPQNESHYKIENRYFIATVKYYLAILPAIFKIDN